MSSQPQRRPLIMHEAWNCMFHLQVEGPEKTRKEKDDKDKFHATREAVMSF